MYDYCVVGAGIFGATFASLAKRAGRSVLVVDKRDHVGGNCYTKDHDGIQVHMAGPHIFHTSDDDIWNFVNEYARFNNYTHRVKAINRGMIYSMPINLMTMYQVFGTITPSAAKARLEKEIRQVGRVDTSTLEGWAKSQVGNELYRLLIKDYTTKQWGRDPSELPSSIVKRLPIRMTYDDNYFTDKHQGIPIGGYSALIENMLDGCDVQLNVDFLKFRSSLESLSHKTIYTGAVDAFYKYEVGVLEYRTLRFEHKRYETDNHQGLAQLNYTSDGSPWTRTIEHKHFEPSVKTAHTIVTHEYSEKWTKGAEPYYPINDSWNNTLYRLYANAADRESRTLFGGRLAKYQYLDMHQAIGAAMAMAKKEGF